MIPCNIQVVSTATDVRHMYAVYTHADADGVIKYVGVAPLRKLFEMEDALSNSLWHDYFDNRFDVLQIQVVGITSNEREAYNEQRRLVGMFNPICNKQGFPIDPKRQPVQCIETGEIFDTATDAARAHGLALSALTNHLNRKVGHRSVKGRTYTRTMKHHGE